MIEYTLADFYLALKDIVTHQRLIDGHECQRINSMILVNTKFDFGNYDINSLHQSPYFFSRNTQEILYPSLVISESYDTYGELKNEKYQRYCHVLEIGIVDQYFEDCSDCTPCKQRTVEQIKHDTSRLLNKVLNEINNIQLFLTQPNNIYKHSTQGIIDQMIAEGKISSATVEHKESMLIKRIIKTTNAEKRTNPYENRAKQIYGKFVVYTMCERCLDNTIEYKLKNIEKEAGIC